MADPVAPPLTFAFRIEAEIASPRRAGRSPAGERLHIPITGGRVHGPRLTGCILPGGSDWPVIGPDGNTRINAHYTIEATDGTLIYVHNSGLRVSSAEALDRVRNGETVSPEDFYMRAAPLFDAPDGPHEWLRRRLFVCTILPSPTEVSIDVFTVG